MRKHFILSSRTFAAKRCVTESFGNDNEIIVPMAVLDKVQNVFATELSERGKIAKENLAYLESYNFNDLKNGVTQANGSTLRVVVINDDYKPLPNDLKGTELTKLEKKILQACMYVKNTVPADEPVILVSRNSVLRMKARVIGIEAETFRDELLPELHEQYKGRIQLDVSEKNIDDFYAKRKLPITALSLPDETKLFENMFVVMKAGYSKKSAIGRVERGYIVPLVFENAHPFGVTPLNVGQKFMIEALMMDANRAPLVIFKGPAGTAKTFLSLAVGLEQTFESNNNNYPRKILYSRGLTEVGDTMGYLPGDEGEKMNPYIRGAMDNLQDLISPEITEEVSSMDSKKNSKRKSSKQKFERSEKPESEDGSYFFDEGYIKIEAINYMRGRSVKYTFVIIDEVQNLTSTEVKAITTRVGKGTKVVLLGDPSQIDKPELDERNNGISYVSERFKGEEKCWQITLEESECTRSELAMLASKLL